MIFVVVIGLGSCTLSDDPEIHGSSEGYSINIAQGTHIVTLPESPAFKKLLNEDSTVSSDDVPAPDIWHELSVLPEQPTTIEIIDCPMLDLLDVITYDMLDDHGKPSGFEYYPLCGPEVKIDCSGTQTLPADIQKILLTTDIEHFAISGICLEDSGRGDQGFITFIKRI